MKFDEFIEFLPKILNQQLPALSAHSKMAPLERMPTLEPSFYTAKNPRLSAVMMLFYPKGNSPHLVLIKRNEYPGIHSSQISFPGGKAEPEDKDSKQTALRETFEEIGIRQNDITVVKPFSTIYIPPSNFLVSPYLGVMMASPVFKPNPGEVQEIIELSLNDLLDDSIVVNAEMQTAYDGKIHVPAFKTGDHLVWGATAMILSELKETIKSALI